MTKEEKDLLFKDLAPRLPYGVKVHIPFLNHVETLIGLDIIDGEIRINGYICDIRPYLRPMSSMTEEEKNELLELVVGKEGMKYFNVSDNGTIDGNDSAEQDLRNFNFHWINFDCVNTSTYIDWLNAQHFDYKGLIEKGLALEAPEGMYQ